VRTELIEIDSQISGHNVLAIHDFDPRTDFAEFERCYIAEYTPSYVSAKVPLEAIGSVHALENEGFRLAECQIRSSIKLRKPYDTSAFPYDFEQVKREEDLKEVLEIAGATFLHDRFSTDPLLLPGISGTRYQAYVLKSFRSPDEAVFRLIDRASGQTVAFKTHRYVGSSEVLFLLGGVHPDLKTLGLGLISEYFEFNELIRKGIKRGVTHISASNYPIFNLEIGQLGFRVVSTFAVMRKVYIRSRAQNGGFRTLNSGQSMQQGNPCSLASL
jgi:hypothetical protein